MHPVWSDDLHDLPSSLWGDTRELRAACRQLRDLCRELHAAPAPPWDTARDYRACRELIRAFPTAVLDHVIRELFTNFPTWRARCSWFEKETTPSPRLAAQLIPELRAGSDPKVLRAAALVTRPELASSSFREERSRAYSMLMRNRDILLGVLTPDEALDDVS